MIRRILNYYRRNLWPKERYARFMGVQIGENCSIHTYYFGTEPYLIEIGNHVQIAFGVQFFTHGGTWVFRDQYPDLDTFGKIKVGNNVYIGGCSLILPGVNIGDNVIIGAGSVVTKSIDNGLIVAGNPARIVGKTEDFVEKIRNYDVGSKGMSYDEKKAFLLSLSDDKFIKK